MKKLYLIILLLGVTFSGMAQNVGDVLYIYRNDGHINGFIVSEVQSLGYSYEDEEGNQYDEIVTQIVTTADSIYKIPMAVIDSISFVTPRTEYQSDAINISENLMTYVESSDGLTFTLSSSTPSSLMPKVGDKLVTVEMNDKFPRGFAGEVAEVNGLQVTCKAVNLEDVLKQFCYVSSTYGVPNNEAPSLTPKRLEGFDFYKNTSFTVPSLPVTGGAEFSAKVLPMDVAIKLGNNWSMNYIPSFHVIFTMIVNEVQGTYINTCVSNDVLFEEELSLYGGLEWSNDDLAYEVPLGTIAPFVKVYLKPGLFLKAGATATLKFTADQRYILSGAFDYSTKGGQLLKPAIGGRMVSSNFDVEGSIDGTIAAGGYIDLGLDLMTDNIAKMCLHVEFGFEVTSDIVLYNSDIASADKDTKLYERLKNSKIEANKFISGSFVVGLTDKIELSSAPLELKFNIDKWDLVPTFSNVSFKRLKQNQTYADAKATLTGHCAFPVEVGLAVLDKDGNELNSYFSDDTFKNEEMNMEYTFPNLSLSEEYGLYPKVKWLHWNMLASPNADIEKEQSDVRTLEAEVTSSSTAVILGEVDYEEDMPGTVFFYYGTDRDLLTNGIRIDVGNAMDWRWSPFSCVLYDLQPSTTYYYMAAYDNGTEVQYGDVLSFTTQDPIIIRTDDAVDVSAAHATLKGCSELTGSDYNYEYGFIYGTSNNLSYYTGTVVVANNAWYSYFSVILSTLSGNNTYYYCAYLIKDGQIFYGETKSFTTTQGIKPCSDSEHPHVIDLGLPSGTKWACCNVGASAHEDFGGFYAFGETTEKEDYSLDTYQYKENGHVVGLGANIAGTKYDVARVQWGAPWMMPTADQCIELIQQCTSEWVVENDVPGRLFVGPNGNTIFLPAAGWREYTNHLGANYYGYYRTSTAHQDLTEFPSWYWMVDGFYFYESSVEVISPANCMHGYSVRPVCK